MTISVVIPVYNVEKYLHECILSIINQDYNDIEIILVDDGSTDSSGEICDYYRAKCSNINVIHQANGGLSDARNVGIKESKGDYLLFVDSDDYIERNSITELVECIKQYNEPDVVFLEAFKVFVDGRTEGLGDNYDSILNNNQSKEVVLKHIASLPKFPGSACTKMIKLDLIRRKKIYFKKGLLSEDIDWTIKLLLSAGSFAYCDIPYYYYRQNREGSITNNVIPKRVQSLLYIIEKWSDKNIEKKYQKEINSYLAYEYVIAMYIYSKLKKKERKKIKGEMKKNQWILKYGRNKKVILSSIVVSVAGIDVASKLLSFYKKS